MERNKPGERRLRRGIVGTVSVAAAIGLLVAGIGGGGAAASTDTHAVSGDYTDGRQSLAGTIDGADYRVEMPEEWNGTLVLYSHGYYPEFWPEDFPIAVANGEYTEQWLIENGYALAASEFQNDGIGFLVEEAQADQLALLNWFEREIGQPVRTVASGQSQGATIAALLVERHPDRFDGLYGICGAYDPQGLYNTGLDVVFALRTLLAPDADIDLVRPRDGHASAEALAEAITEARAIPEGRARLALAASLNNVTGWYTAHQPRPEDPERWIQQQADWLTYAYTLGFGPPARPDLESKLGGNPSYNIGVDYRHQLARSAQTELVEDAYEAAGLDLRDDLRTLNTEPRILPDPQAVASMYRLVPRGAVSVPVVTVHTTGDGGATPDGERWYADQVRRAGNAPLLRQVFVDRGQHCSISAAEEVTVLQTLLERIETGSWSGTDPATLTAAVTGFAPADSEYHLARDFGTWEIEPVDPAFIDYTPPKPMRPSR